MSIGKRIAEFRKAKGLTQAELGNILGVSNQAVSKWESELTTPDVMLLPEIAKALGVTLNALYGMPEEAAPLAKVDDGEDRRILHISVRAAGADVKVRMPVAALQSVFGAQMVKQNLGDENMQLLLGMLESNVMGKLVEVNKDGNHVLISVEEYEN